MVVISDFSMKKAVLLFVYFSSFAACISPVLGQRKISSSRIEVTSCLDATPDSDAFAIVVDYKVAVDSMMAPVLGESLVGMAVDRPESSLSNWAADVMVEFSDFENGTKADLGLVNMGGLRNNMPKGVVRTGDIILISPFNNKLSIVYLKGSDLLSLFQDIAHVHGEGVSREVRLVITKDGQLVSAMVGGQPINPERIYRIATLDYLAEGNDKMYALKKAQKLVVSDLFTRDCMMQSIQRAKVITSQIEGRITIKD